MVQARRDGAGGPDAEPLANNRIQFPKACFSIHAAPCVLAAFAFVFRLFFGSLRSFWLRHRPRPQISSSEMLSSSAVRDRFWRGLLTRAATDARIRVSDPTGSRRGSLDNLAFLAQSPLLGPYQRAT
ncbi:hypothetical protein C8J57DRAFT_1470308 [Mycena rebaudengoi]|nr:hypothetical protein C8J57DRAFT_1470308 [Mycena rebaudengoi]